MRPTLVSRSPPGRSRLLITRHDHEPPSRGSLWLPCGKAWAEAREVFALGCESDFLLAQLGMLGPDLFNSEDLNPSAFSGSASMFGGSDAATASS